MTNGSRTARSGRASVPHLLAAAILSVACTAVQAADAPADGGPAFAISRFAVEGNSLLPGAEIDALLAPFTGTARDFGDVRRAVETLQQAYRRHGYNVVVVRLPEQELAGGVVRVQVIEPRIGAVTVEGNRAFSTANIRASLPGLREGTVPNIRDISASLKVANTSPAKQTTLALQSADQPEAVDAVVRVADEKPSRIGLLADNTGNPATGRSRLSLLYQHANLFGLDHVASIQYTTSPEQPRAVNVVGGGYHLPLYAAGDSMDFFASHSNSDSGSVQAGVLNLLVSGKGTVLGGRYNRHLPQWGDLVSTLIFGADWRAYEDSVVQDEAQLGGKVTIRPVSVAYSGQWTLPSSFLDASVTALQNIPGGSNGSDADFSAQRVGAKPNYRILRYAAAYNQRVAADWQLRLRLNGQLTDSALVPGEQFGAGGASSVRGFLEREVAGDEGYFASAEVQTPNWCPASQTLAVECRAVAFVDGARISRNDALPGEIQHQSIASTGVGLRFGLGPRSSLQMDYARVIDGGGLRHAGDSRVHVSLFVAY